MKEITEQINNLKEDIMCEEFYLKHFQKEMENYYSNVICYEFLSADDMMKNWKEAVNNVAMYVQAKLKKTIEIYNVYIIFFCKDVPGEITNIIEQNKYSSRKIVMNNKMPTERTRLETLINKKLFEFDLSKKEPKASIVKETIKKESVNLLEYLEDKEHIDKDDLEVIISILGIK